MQPEVTMKINGKVVHFVFNTVAQRDEFARICYRRRAPCKVSFITPRIKHFLETKYPHLIVP